MLTIDHPAFAAHEPISDSRATQLADLGFSQWETSWSRPSLSNRYFEVFLARPRGAQTSFSFLLKALRPEFCRSSLGIALVERERALGSIDSRHMLPTIDYLYPRAHSANQARRGYVVSPCFPGMTLAKFLRRNKKIDANNFARLHHALREIASALQSCGWSLSEIAPEQVLLTFESAGRFYGKLRNVMLVDYSNAFRFTSPSLFVEPTEPLDDYHSGFDPYALLSPCVFCRDDLDRDSTRNATLKLLRELTDRQC